MYEAAWGQAMAEIRPAARLSPARRRLLDRELDRLLELDQRARQKELNRLKLGHPRIAAWLERLVLAMEETDQQLTEPLARLAEHWAADSGSESRRQAAAELEAQAAARHPARCLARHRTGWRRWNGTGLPG